MYLPKESYDCVCSYMLGMDVACAGDLMDGFHDWLVPTVGHGDNLAWQGLVLYLAFPNSQVPRSRLGDPTNEKVAISCLFMYFESFVNFKQTNGLNKIKLRYQS